MFWKDIRQRAALATGNFAKVFADTEIPPLPRVAARVVQLAQEPDPDIDGLSQVIASDTGLAAKVLRMVNSSHFGLRHRVTDVQHAVVLVGVKRVQMLAQALSTVDALPRSAKGFERLAFWQDSLQRAVFAQSLASAIAPGGEGEAFTGALLQNMALPILLSRWGDHYFPVVTLARETDRELFEAEDEKLTWNHAQAGAWLARNWGFIDALVCCIGLHHHTPEQLETLNLMNTPVAAVAWSSYLPNAQTICRDALGLDTDVYRQHCETTNAMCSEIAGLFGVPEPPSLAPESDKPEN